MSENVHRKKKVEVWRCATVNNLILLGGDNFTITEVYYLGRQSSISGYTEDEDKFVIYEHFMLNVNRVPVDANS